MRFYQKAYKEYQQALANSSDLDIQYNIARLVYHVYSTYIETELLEDLNTDDFLFGDTVVKPLDQIMNTHEQSMNGRESMDLSYNLGLVYIDVLETSQLSDDNVDVLQIYQKGQELFKNLINTQINQLRSFINDLSKIDNDHSSSNEDPQSVTEAVTEEVLQPNDVFDTIVSGYKLIQAFLGNITSIADIPSFQQVVGDFSLFLESIVGEFLNSFTESTNTQSQYLSSVTNNQIIDYQITKAFISSLISQSFTEINNFWDVVPPSAERFMSQSDAVQAIIDRNDDNDSTLWLGLTLITQTLKKAQDDLLERRKTTVEGLGKLNEQYAQVLIQRADIDVQRGLLPLPQAQNSKEVLMKNARTFLTSAMRIANSSGGLRERAIEKAGRNKKKLESVARMCILDKKDEDQIMEIMGSVGPREITKVLKLDYYSALN